MKKIVLITFILIGNYLFSQPVILKTPSNLIVFSHMSNEDFDVKNASEWNGNVKYLKSNVIITGGAIFSTSSKVGYLLGIIEVNYNHQAKYYSDLVDDRKIVRIYKPLKNKKGFESQGKTYFISKNETLLSKPYSNSKWSLTLIKPTLEELKKLDLKTTYLDSPEYKAKMLKEKERENQKKDSIKKIEDTDFYYKINNKNTNDELKIKSAIISVVPHIGKYTTRLLITYTINIDGKITDVYWTNSDNFEKNIVDKYLPIISEEVKKIQISPFVGLKNGKKYISYNDLLIDY
ncbi:hypothetical protein [Flavobacterium sp.]|uniref:hypothetical protein n=1 Tax=Flavobacterium sp. TaxID=239 RepID=UPI00375218DF